jgi:hypothetical protein
MAQGTLSNMELIVRGIRINEKNLTKHENIRSTLELYVLSKNGLHTLLLLPYITSTNILTKC